MRERRRAWRLRSGASLPQRLLRRRWRQRRTLPATATCTTASSPYCREQRRRSVVTKPRQLRWALQQVHAGSRRVCWARALEPAHRAASVPACKGAWAASPARKHCCGKRRRSFGVEQAGLREVPHAEGLHAGVSARPLRRLLRRAPAVAPATHTVHGSVQEVTVMR